MSFPLCFDFNLFSLQIKTITFSGKSTGKRKSAERERQANVQVDGISDFNENLREREA